MTIFELTGLIYFDVDDTLVMYDLDLENEDKHKYIKFYSNIKDKEITLRVNEEHVDLLKSFSRRGKGIVVWTHAGYQWAEEVIEALDIYDYVNIVIEKPDRVVDDQPIGNLAKQLYLNPQGGEK